MQDSTQHYINGQWVASIDGREMAVENPSTEEKIATITLGGDADADAAVAAAKTAFPGWAATEPEARIDALERLMDIYKERAGEMAEAISHEMGAPIALAQMAQVGAGAGHLKNTIRTAKGFAFERPLGDHAPDDMILYEPVGVCALITPWNWPMNQVMLKVAPALAAGCTMVLKPAEQAPLSAMLLAEMIEAAGFPPGVFNLVNGDGAGVGAHITAHPDVDMVSFTGSTRAGVAITKSAADTVKRVSLELGGKGANIIFADADEKAVTRGVRHCFNNSGQSCNAPTRMLVERSVYDKAIDTARRVTEKTEVGPAEIEGRQIGPVVSETQFNKIQFLIKRGIDEGATLVAGGLGRPDGLNRGHFVRPTIFADVTPEMTIWKEEIFGPVLCITPFDGEDEAIALANDTPYGLTNYVQTTDKSRARRVARQLRSGMVEMNGKPGGAGSPFGGMKQSGNGREGGVWGLEEFLEVKAVSDWG
ncbi:aldehyde dehydrogenase family protein [Pseudohalocynthiibacter sp. F2068]|jgi:aldehyde dehydrogenase (NAD+)|uniref:aldehyde dehydrogenase family protein n=1 Tax=Pseudohalocynthiibacter sp. F2068 TaxID=2926418 RepID=UPI001FF4C824|nr:aldehyde dehydrogenase family protein [Pseudohalocynthiibacter sp. F2068]MCK0104179.1 aldehyde dehydrogenase family protein [Pseudohalocynthiibacter sp. F2068]